MYPVKRGPGVQRGSTIIHCQVETALLNQDALFSLKKQVSNGL